MIRTFNGIVLKSIKYGETSMISEVYTREHGLKKFIAGSVRKAKSRMSPGLFQPMSLVQMVAYEKPGKDLNRVKDISPLHLYRHMPMEINRTAVGLFITEVVRYTIRTDESNPELFDFLLDVFRFLDETDRSIANLPLSFLVLYSGWMGFEPENNYSEEKSVFDLQEGRFNVVSTGLQQIEAPLSSLFSQLLASDMESSADIKIKRKDRQQLLQSLLDYYYIHIDYMKKVQTHLIFEGIL